MAYEVLYSTGRRKTSTARVRVTEGSGKLTANGRSFDAYFTHENFAKQAYAPLLTVELRDKIDVSANVSGGGVAGQAGAVEHEGHRQVLQAHLLEHLVEGALEEGAVDVDDRPAAGFRLSGGEGDGVRLADPDVEKAVGELLAHRLELVALAHGGGEHGDPGVLPDRPGQLPPPDVDGDHVGGSRLQQAVGEPAGGRTSIKHS